MVLGKGLDDAVPLGEGDGWTLRNEWSLISNFRFVPLNLWRHIDHTIGKKMRRGWLPIFGGCVLWVCGCAFLYPLGDVTWEGCGRYFPLGEGDGWTLRNEWSLISNFRFVPPILGGKTANPKSGRISGGGFRFFGESYFIETSALNSVFLTSQYNNEIS